MSESCCEENENYVELCLSNLSYVIDAFDDSDFISRRLLRGEVWEPRVVNYIKQNINDTTFFDFGTNIGCHTFVAHLYGAKHVYGFECNPTVYEKIINTININKFPNINVYNVGVSNVNSVYPFIQLNYNIGASYIQNNSIQDTYVKFDRCERKNIDVVKFDDFFDMGLIRTSNIMLKMDIEGHEYEGLEGMKKLLNDDRTHSIIIELNPTTTTIRKLQDVVNLLLDFEFTVMCLIFDVTVHDWSGQELNNNINFEYVTVDYIFNKLKKGIILEVGFEKPKQH